MKTLNEKTMKREYIAPKDIIVRLRIGSMIAASINEGGPGTEGDNVEGRRAIRDDNRAIRQPNAWQEW